MYSLTDKKYISSVQCGENFGYVLENNELFVPIDYKVLQNQTNGIFAKCLKLLYNGKIEIMYLVDEFQPIIPRVRTLSQDVIIQFACRVFYNIIEVRNNGFLSSQNIDISWDRIFLDPTTMKPKLIYIPIREKAFENFAEFETELRKSFVRLVKKEIPYPEKLLSNFLEDADSQDMSMDELYMKYRRNDDVKPTPAAEPVSSAPKETENKKDVLKMVAMNGQFPNIEIDRDLIRIGNGRDMEWADEIVGSNMISRQQCKIRRHNGMYYISDGGDVKPSTNGTYLNDVLIGFRKAYPIKRGDKIRLADIIYTIQ